MISDDIKLYLPKYLSEESEKELFQGIRDFPKNLSSRFYTGRLKGTEIIYQGDGLRDLSIVNLPSTNVGTANCIVLSNTCDIDIENKRSFPSQLVYAPIFNLSKYRQMMLSGKYRTEQQTEDHIAAIKRQEITQIFYLPAIDDILDESLVFLDRIFNFPNKLISRDGLNTRRLFTLSDLGAYLFIMKLSIHFTRIQDKVERGSGLSM